MGRIQYFLMPVMVFSLTIIGQKECLQCLHTTPAKENEKFIQALMCVEEGLMEVENIIQKLA